MKANKFGFTLIELLIVVSVIGILSGVLVSVINVPRKRAEAQDAVKMSNLQSLVIGLEAYNASEGSYPTDSDNNGNPYDSGDSDYAVVSIYLKLWPTGFVYFKSGNNCSVYIPKSTSPTDCYKYLSSLGRIFSCSGTTCARDLTYSPTSCIPL